ncbi:MAG: L-2-hydroxyglutarate oxidase [Nitriliruptorales bacterium]|nr:L-2-hydroxyglutarate oxidase [Nitriliruptorales bacterium]
MRASRRREFTDVVVVGGGIVGLSVAHHLLLARPGAGVVLLEKERALAQHQTGRNSGVIHSGIYYRPGSLKARTVARGRQALLDYCEQHDIIHERCGKVIVATDQAQEGLLEGLRERAAANGVKADRIGSDRLRELEPHARGRAALHVPDAGIVDFRAVCAVLATGLRTAGADIRLSNRVTGVIEEANGVTVLTPRGPIRARQMVNCAGLYADRIAAMAGRGPRAIRIVPFRGEYYELVPERRGLVRNLIYPVPDPAFPFLGVHFTRMIDGSVHAGPNAVLALSREGYRWSSINVRDSWETLRHPGFRRLVRRHARTGFGEVHRSLRKQAFVGALQGLVPEVGMDDLVPSTAGVRAQALAPDGRLVDDFVLEETPRALHVLNAPSPAATASFEIGRRIAERVTARAAMPA